MLFEVDDGDAVPRHEEVGDVVDVEDRKVLSGRTRRGP